MSRCCGLPFKLAKPDFPGFLKFEYWRQDGDEEAIKAGLAAVDERSLSSSSTIFGLDK